MIHVLLIDDDPWQLEHFDRQLSQAGFRVSQASNALAAMDLIDSDSPQVLVVDMMMPGPSGLTLLHELQSHADLMQLPVIICSAVPLKLSDLAPYGVVAVLDKTTINQHDLVAAVKKALM